MHKKTIKKTAKKTAKATKRIQQRKEKASGRITKVKMLVNKKEELLKLLSKAKGQTMSLVDIYKILYPKGRVFPHFGGSSTPKLLEAIKEIEAVPGGAYNTLGQIRKYPCVALKLRKGKRKQ